MTAGHPHLAQDILDTTESGVEADELAFSHLAHVRSLVERVLDVDCPHGARVSCVPINPDGVCIDAVYLDIMHPSTCIVDRLVVDGTPSDSIAIAIGDLVVVMSALDT